MNGTFKWNFCLLQQRPRFRFPGTDEADEFLALSDQTVVARTPEELHEVPHDSIDRHAWLRADHQRVQSADETWVLAICLITSNSTALCIFPYNFFFHLWHIKLSPYHTTANAHLHQAHLQNKHSNSVELYGSASASKSNGISVATTQSAVRPSRLTKCAASTYCLPSHKTESRRSTWCALSEPFLSSFRHIRTRSRLFMIFLFIVFTFSLNHLSTPFDRKRSFFRTTLASVNGNCR